MICSKKMLVYFDKIQEEVFTLHKLANQARSLLFDPEPHVDIKLARNMAERVTGLISVVSPQIANSKITDRIIELERKYAPLDWRVALEIALEVAQEKFCTFKDKKEAIEVGIRTGFAYQTGGIVSAPLEGFIELKIKKTKEGKEYFAPCYAGPIRGAGGTAAAFSLLITDFVRKQLGYATYDPDENEINRYKSEIYDYNERVTNLQYLPSLEEIEFLCKHIPIEVDGDPTEIVEVSNYKDLPRVETNRIRGGVCLVLAEGLAQKSPKLWKRLESWGDNMGMQDWQFLGDFIKLQKEIKSRKKTTEATNEKKEKISPNFTFIADTVAGRPILTYPMRVGGFRLRYGRGRTTGFSAAAINPAVMYLLKKYIAIGTQLKVERPGKAAAIATCTSIEGSIVKLHDGTVMRINTIELAKQYASQVAEILYLGDFLFNYGDFSENGHLLIPCGYNEEWWERELEKAAKDKYGDYAFKKIAESTNISEEELRDIISTRNKEQPAEQIITLSEKMNIPLHPYYTFHWKQINNDEMLYLENKLRQHNQKDPEDKIILPYDEPLKKIAESIGIPHLTINNEFIVFKKNEAKILQRLFKLDTDNRLEKTIDRVKSALENLSAFSGIAIRDKSGTFIGARMGRPEKAKIRELTGSPHVLFPIGDEGGRLRSFQAALDVGKVTGDFPLYKCSFCNQETIYATCDRCFKPTQKTYYCKLCGIINEEKCIHGKAMTYKEQVIDIKRYFSSALKQLKTNHYPDLIKGVRGTASKDHIPEHLIKGILRAKHTVYVNKDGTIRCDMSELPLTHFKPKEIHTPVLKLKELGYEQDIYGKELTNEDQIIEIKPQDVILPACSEALDEPIIDVLYRVSLFVDELLEKLYGLPPYYNLKNKHDLTGHLVLALAPHISAGMVGRIIGFSNTQGFIAHPLFHAALRRDCFVYDTMILIYDGITWRNVKIGELVEDLKPTTIVDSYGTKEIKIHNYTTIGFDDRNNVTIVNINNFTKHTPVPILHIKTATGRAIKTTYNHKFIIKDSKIKSILAHELKTGDCLLLPKSMVIDEKNQGELNLLDVFSNRDDIVIRNVKHLLKIYSLKDISRELNIKYRNLQNYHYRNSFPLSVFQKITERYNLSKDTIQQTGKLAAKRDTVTLPVVIPLNNEFFEYLGLYVAEGFSRYNKQKKGYTQVYIACLNMDIRNKLINFGKTIGLKPTERKTDRVTFSSRLWYEIIVNYFKCGKDAYSKRVPTSFFSADKKALSAFLRGYFEGDGSVSVTDKRVCCDSANNELLQDIHLLLLKYGIFSRFYEYTKQPGPKVKEFYIRKNRQIPFFTCTKLSIPSNFVEVYANEIGFISERKSRILSIVAKKKHHGMKLKHDEHFIYDPIIEITEEQPQPTYCLNVENHVVLANGILTRQCDGDEGSVSLLLDCFLNFSSQFLPNTRGAKTMDAPLVLTSLLNPSEVDDQAHGLDVVWQYPLEFYEAALEYKMPWQVPIEQLNKRLGKETQYEQLGFTHDTIDFNLGVPCSAYKSLPSMEEKLQGQMEIATMIRAVNDVDVAELVINKHFLKDIKGNLRKFSQQQFRCTKCNEKFRRPPLIGKCTKCGGKILFTVHESSVIKYLGHSLNLAEKYHVAPYLKQNLDLLKRRIESVFGKEKETQTGLAAWA